MSVIAFGIFIFKIHDLTLVWLAYGLGGIGIGSFESNLLSAITPLGHRTKLWATLGIPAGVVIITVGSFVVFAVTDVPVLSVYLTVLFLLVCSLIMFLCFVRTRCSRLLKLTHHFPMLSQEYHSFISQEKSHLNTALENTGTVRSSSRQWWLLSCLCRRLETVETVASADSTVRVVLGYWYVMRLDILARCTLLFMSL